MDFHSTEGIKHERKTESFLNCAPVIVDNLQISVVGAFFGATL